MGKEHWILKVFTIAFFAAMFVNLLFLDFYLYRSSRQQPLRIASTTQQSQVVLPIPQKETTQQIDISSIYDAIYQATTSLSLAPTTPATIIREIVATSPQTATVDHDYFITLGSGSSNATDWTDVAGLSVSIDTAKYTNITQVLFEASLFIPTGNQKAYVRLVNVTDKHPVWFSELSHEGGQAKLLISPNLSLDTGLKLYQVQMKTQLGFTTSLTQARLRITAQ